MCCCSAHCPLISDPAMPPLSTSDLISSFSVPRADQPLDIEFRSSSTVLLLGANGAGKTRLSVAIEQALGDTAHRIGAHRSLTMKTTVHFGSLAGAKRLLRYGFEADNAHMVQYRLANRWRGEPATALLSDFDALLQALYAEQAEVSVQYTNAPDGTVRPKTKLRRLSELWQHLLPRRKLVIAHGSVHASDADGTVYDAHHLSDGERVIFYLLGHALLAEEGSVVIVDEPELHVNRAILQSLWDAIESERQDCCFVYVTHDLEMAASRRGAVRYAVEGYKNAPDQWKVEPIPDDTGLPEELVAKIIGSRLPILFVEGTSGSLDTMLYRHVYTRFTVHGAGSCDDVIRTVSSFNRHGFLHRVGCAGLVDADDRDASAIAKLTEINIHALPVAEIENFMLLPGPFLALAKIGVHLSEAEAEKRLNELQERVFHKAQDNLAATAIEAARRKVDALLKRVELEKSTAQSMDDSYKQKIAQIAPMEIYKWQAREIEVAIQAKDYVKVLLLYANKGLFAEAAAVLRLQRAELERLIGRLLGADAGQPLLREVRAALPSEELLLSRLG